MNLVCLDLEGVLVPEIWIAFAEATGIPELKRTTRDEPDYDKLMALHRRTARARAWASADSGCHRAHRPSARRARVPRCAARAHAGLVAKTPTLQEFVRTGFAYTRCDALSSVRP